MVNRPCITSDWMESTLGHMADYINGRAFKPNDWGSSGLPIIRIEQINDSEASCDYYDGHVDDQHRIENGDLIFSWSATLTTQVWTRGPAVLNQHIFKVVPAEGVDLAFLHHLLDHSLDGLDRKSHGSTMKHVKRSDLLPFKIRAPLLYEQRRIAEILDTIDEAIQKTEALISKLKAMKQGLLHDLLTRGLDKNGKLRDPKVYPEQFKDSPLGKIPKEWDVNPLEKLAEVDRGKFTHRPRNDPRFYGGAYPFVQTGDIAEAEGDILKKYSQTLNNSGSAVSREFPKNTIAITIAANIADTAILGQPMYFPDSIVGAIVRPPNNVRYIELCIRRAKRILNAHAPQSAQKNINLEDLRPLLIPIPTSEEQKRIGDMYDAYSNCVQSEEQYRDKLKLQKKGLMHDLLTGKVRVRT